MAKREVLLFGKLNHTHTKRNVVKEIVNLFCIMGLLNENSTFTQSAFRSTARNSSYVIPGVYDLSVEDSNWVLTSSFIIFTMQTGKCCAVLRICRILEICSNFFLADAQVLECSNRAACP